MKVKCQKQVRVVPQAALAKVTWKLGGASRADPHSENS